jgi:hypothetical protein
MYGLIVGVLALVLLVLCWLMADCEFRTKVILTIVYIAMWPLIFISDWLLLFAQLIFASVVWWVTFGGRR